MRPSLLLLLALGGCAAVDPQPETRDQRQLRQELAGRITGAPESCVPATGSAGLQPVDSRTLIYRKGRTLWVNRLASACPGVRPLNTSILEVRGSRYCRGDHVRGLELGSSIPGPVCILGDFTPYRAR